jgi:D-alanyl-D-alanine dipeptidase
MFELPFRKILVCLMFLPNFLIGQNCHSEDAMLNAGLQDIQKSLPKVLVELRYSSTNNFVGQDVYGCLSKAFARPEVLNKLRVAFQHLQKKHPGFTFLIYDAARPSSAQKALWKAIKLPESKKHIYLANPKRGSIHNYGCALDITLAGPDGKAIDMGTEFDYFGELAQPRCEVPLLKSGKLSQKQFNNRKILRSCMESAGFLTTSSEWWHFNSCSLSSAKARYKIIP